MGDSKLCLLLLLSTSALAVAQDGDQPTCLLAQRYKTLHKYQYRYEAESLNAINGGSALKNGPKASCMVEIEVPQTCSFIVRTTDCSLSEVVDMDAEGHPVFGPAPSSDAFAAEMERYPLKVVIEGVYNVELYPEEGETTTILNIKRGIISALAVPLTEEDKNKNMPTIHGMCKTSYTINAREDIATDITLNRDLSRCNNFVPMRDHTSPLALISGMHYPLAQLVRSSQTCNYKFDNEKKHMTSGSCTENHILIPFSHKGEYGVTNVGKQELILVDVSAHNDRVFERSDIVKGLHMEAVEGKTVVQDKDAWLALLRELATLPETEGERRAHLFHKLVTMVRGMKTETLTPAVPEALEVSRLLTYQVLAQCGTPECSSAIMQILRTFDSSSLEVDATVVAMGLVSNPSALLIHDMLEMAKYKSSKPIMYALSNVVKRLYKTEGKMIPEIHSVAEFMAAQLGDCSGDKDNTFMTLRVVGNMAPAVVPASPALRAAVMQCVNQPSASPAVQQAAIQVYRLTPVPEEAREVLMQVLLDTTSTMQKRIAAYLVLMKDPQPSELAQLVSAMTNEQDQQMKSFVISHMTNILSSTEPETTELRDNIRGALQGNEIGPVMDATKFSRNYKIGSVEGNMIFEGTSYLPKELMLEMTLKAFGYDIDMMEIGMEGKGFEPTVDALFGENGFFPDTTLKTMYFVSDNMPVKIQEVMHNILPTLRRDRMKRQASQNLIKEVGRNLNKLVNDLKAAESPEAMVYLRLLGNELGYLRTNEMEEMAYSAAMMIDNMLKMFPAGLIMEMMTKTDNTMFAHYIFMDNEFFMPTATGVPLRIALSGTFTPGIKGGLKISRGMNEVAFMPSAGVEFSTQVGSHIPEYIDAGLEMLTNIFHESGLTAKISMERDQVKLTIPAPMSPTKIFKMTNTLVAVTGSEVKPMPPMVTDKVDVSECTPFFAGMKYCTALQYTDAFSVDTAPYFPFTGDSKFAVELHPTGEVTEYTATVAYELLREGEEGRQKVDSVNFIVRAEGAAPTEARAIMKYNRRRNIITADFQIPDYDVEAGFRLGVVDGNTKGKGTHSISLDLINKNVPQLSLVGRAKLEAMIKGMLQVQLLVPSISTDATFTAMMTREEELEMEVKSEIKVMDAMSEQKIEMKYDGSKVELKFKSDVNADTTTMPTGDILEKYGNQLLDTQVGQTDMKVREIFVTFVEAANNYMEQYGADIPYIQNLRVPGMPEISLPESLFLNTEAKAVYYFNNERLTLAIPLPLGGKSTEELNFPAVLTTPHMSLPQLGLEITSMEIPMPELFVPESITLSIPLFGKAEVSALMKSNLYDMEASLAAGKDVVEVPSYSAMFDVRGTSPIDILSFKVEGSGMLATTDSIKAQLKSSLAHKFIEASVSIVEDASITDKVNVKSSSKIEVTSPFGLNIALEHTGLAGINTEEISADSNFDGTFQAGPIYGKAISTQTSTIFPFRPEAKIDSSVQIDSTIVRAQNTIAATLANGEFSIVSNTNAFEDTISHVGELSFKDNKLSLKCDANAFALGMKIRNQAEASAGAGEIAMRLETNADHSENRIYSLLTASLDASGVSVNSGATARLFDHEATHKVVLTINRDGLTTSGNNTIQSLFFMENTFDAVLDASRATLSINNKAAMQAMKVENANTLMITLSSLNFNSKTEASASEETSYTHDISIDLQPYTASASVNNNLKVFSANFMNEAQLQAELYKMDLTGSMKAMYGEQDIKHTYQVNYADLSANAKCSTIGRLFGTHISHNTDLEIIGLAAKLTNDARFHSQPMRFDHTIRCSIVPFDFNLDAIFNGDGEMTMYGKHSAQLYGKFLLKAQPLNFASSHECRASMTQQLDNSLSLETIYENNLDTLLSLEEQRATYKMKSKMNEHALNNDLSIYNNAERAGMEVSAIILTNIINSQAPENQQFSISGFLKYDKNTNSHVIEFPLMEYVPVLLEEMKGFVVRIAEALQNFISNEEIRAKLVALPDHVSEFVSNLNIEGKVMKVKEYISDLTQNYLITTEDVEASFENLKVTLSNLMADLTSQIRRLVGMMKEIIDSNNLPEALTRKIEEQLNAFNEAFEIKAAFIYVIDTMRAMIQQIDLEKLRGSSIAFLHELDNYYKILSKLQIFLDELKNFTENFDMLTFMTELKNKISSIDFNALVVNLRWIVTELVEWMEWFIQEFDIVGKINTQYAKIREVIVNLNIDQKVQDIFEKVLELINQLRIQDTVGTIVQMFKDANIPTRVMEVSQTTIDYFKTTDIKEIIQHLNRIIDLLVNKLKSWDYNNFVDYANPVIAEFTSSVNELIRALQIPQKLEAARDFINYLLSSAKGLMDQVKELKIAEIVKSFKDIIDQFVLNDFRRFLEMFKEEIRAIEFREIITFNLRVMSRYYKKAIATVTNIITGMVEMMAMLVPDQKIISEIQQIVVGVMTEMKKTELNIASFTIPLTDLVVPPMRISMDKLHQIAIPTQLDIPEFTILGFHTVTATTISFDDIKQKIFDLIDFIINFDINMIYVDAFFGDLTLNYLPSMPEINLPEITLPEISFPTIPQVPVEKLIKSIQVPEIKLPTIPSEIMVPCFGKLYGEIRFNTPIYTMKTYAEFQNSTENPLTPQFTGVFTSQATSPNYEFVDYSFESSAHIALPKRSRIVLTETMKFTNLALGVDHQASLSLYGPAAQAQAKTTVKVTTTPYTADFMNIAFIGLEGGMSASLNTNYNHQLTLPMISVTSEAALTQKAIARLDGYTLTLTVDNTGNGKINEEAGNHKSNLQLSLTPKIFTLTFTGDTDSMLLKMKQQITAESGNLVYLTFNLRNEAESPFVKNSLVVANGHFDLYAMKAELRANHDTELVGSVSGVLSNGINIVAKPFDIVFEFQNKGNTKVNILDAIKAKIDLQNDYSVILKTDSQQINTVALARFNQFKMFYNVTVDNNKNEAGIFVAMDNEANLDFLTYPVNIPEIELPFIDFHSPAINDVNLYEQTGLKNLLLTTDQSIDVDAKIVYKKGQNAPIANFMDLIQIPSVGDLITELSFKSAIINLNANAGLYTEDDLVFRLGATTASEFEGLQAKLDGTTSLTTKRGIKLANSLSLENRHLQGTHDSTISMSTVNLETAVAVATIAKIALPILNLEVSQNLLADTKTKANAHSTLKMKCDFNIPLIKAVGKADADHSLKVEGTFEDVSMESSIGANMDGTVLNDYLALGMLDTDFNIYLSNEGLRSTSKFISDAKLNYTTTKVISMDMNENLAVEASMSRVYAVLKYTGNNEINLFNFNTNGKHVAQATMDLAPISSLTADIEIDVSQPSSVGDFSIFEKSVAEMTLSKQKISTNAKFVSPLYTTTMAAELEGNAPVFKVTFKSSADSVFVFIEYDMDASSTTTLENETLSMINKAVLTHTDLAMDVNHVLTHVWRREPQADDSVSRHTLNVDITSSTFTDVNLRYAARRDGISASVSTPSTGFLGLQFSGRMPSQMSARVYGRYPSAPEVDVDVLTIRSSSQDSDKMNLQINYNMEAPKMMLSELKMKFNSIISTITEFADKYQITRSMMELKSNIVNRFSEAYNAAINYDDQMSQLSIFFRNFIVQYQKTIQVFLDAAIKVLRETQFKLPGSEEMTTLPEVLKRLTSSIAAMLETTIQMVYENMEAYYNIFVEKISNLTVRMPIGDAINGGQMLDKVNTVVRTIFNELLDFVRNIESLDTMLVKIGETLKAIVDKSQEFIDSIQSDYLDDVFVNINFLHRKLVTVIKNLMDQISSINMEQLNSVYDNVLDMLIYVVDQFNIVVNNFMQQASVEAQAYMKVNGGRLEIDLPFPFHQ